MNKTTSEKSQTPCWKAISEKTFPTLIASLTRENEHGKGEVVVSAISFKIDGAFSFRNFKEIVENVWVD